MVPSSGVEPDFRPRKTAVCTIVAKNYLPYARTLMNSVAVVHPDWDRYVLLADEIDGRIDPACEQFTLVRLSDLPLPEPRKFLYRYDILELNTAVKPWFLQWLFDRTSVQNLVYLDPDIRVYAPLAEVVSRLAGGALMTLTPHLLSPSVDTSRPNDTDILRVGCYNLGFVALARHRELSHFLRWWQEKLTYDCRNDLEDGMFVDQKWMDLVPGMFADVSIIRDPGYNVAYWNVQHRDVQIHNGRPEVNRRPLAFFHFSGLDPLDPEMLSKHQDRHKLKKLPGCRELIAGYCREVVANGWNECHSWPYAYGTFFDGNPIHRTMRRYYRSHPEAISCAGDDPFRSTHAYLNEPFDDDQPLVTRLMHYVWQKRIDLREAFPDIRRGSRIDFMEHFISFGSNEEGIPEGFVQPVREALEKWRGRLRTVGGEADARGNWLLRAAVKVASTLIPVFRSPERLKWIANKLRPFRFVVPRSIRRQLKCAVRREVGRKTAVRPKDPSPLPVRVIKPTGAGLNVVGYFEVESGVGESARLSVQAAAAVGLPTTECDITPDTAQQSIGRRSGRAYTTDNPHAVILMHVNADQTPHIRGLLGGSYFTNRHTVGVWHWELPRFPERWLPAFNCVDEIWAPSRFILETLAVCSPKPVHLLPHAIRFSPSPGANRHDFGLPDDDFLFLMMYDVQSYSPRKNPEGAIEAFRRAFGDASGVTLVIKVNNSFGGMEPDERLRELVGGAKNIRIFARKLDRQRTYDLLSVCDSVVSLHRSEGFGLVLAEAMYLGKPVVATGWSGNTEFMTAANSCLVDYRPVVLDRDIGPYERGQVWAEPDRDSAAALMKRLATDAEHARRIGEAGQRTIRTRLSPESIGGLYRERLRAISNCEPRTIRIHSPAA